MADTTFTYRDNQGNPIPMRAIDNGDGTYSMAMGGAGSDAVNNVVEVVQRAEQGALVSGADGALWEGVGDLVAVHVYNGSGSAITYQLYDDSSAVAGNKIGTTRSVATLATDTVLFHGKTLAIGVFIDFSTPTSCEARAFVRASD